MQHIIGHFVIPGNWRNWYQTHKTKSKHTKTMKITPKQAYYPYSPVFVTNTQTVQTRHVTTGPVIPVSTSPYAAVNDTFGQARSSNVTCAIGIDINERRPVVIWYRHESFHHLQTEPSDLLQQYVEAHFKPIISHCGKKNWILEPCCDTYDPFWMAVLDTPLQKSKCNYNQLFLRKITNLLSTWQKHSTNSKI